MASERFCSVTMSDQGLLENVGGLGLTFALRHNSAVLIKRLVLAQHPRINALETVPG